MNYIINIPEKFNENGIENIRFVLNPEEEKFLILFKYKDNEYKVKNPDEFLPSLRNLVVERMDKENKQWKQRWPEKQWQGNEFKEIVEAENCIKKTVDENKDLLYTIREIYFPVIYNNRIPNFYFEETLRHHLFSDWEHDYPINDNHPFVKYFDEIINYKSPLIPDGCKLPYGSVDKAKYCQWFLNETIRRPRLEIEMNKLYQKGCFPSELEKNMEEVVSEIIEKGKKGKVDKKILKKYKDPKKPLLVEQLKSAIGNIKKVVNTVVKIQEEQKETSHLK